MSLSTKYTTARAAHAADPDPVFVVSYSRLAWHVTLDGAEFGSYRSKQNAVNGVNEARQATDKRLLRAKLVMGAIEP